MTQPQVQHCSTSCSTFSALSASEIGGGGGEAECERTECGEADDAGTGRRFPDWSADESSSGLSLGNLALNS